MQKSNTYYSHTRKKKPIATCTFTVQEAFLSLFLLHRSRIEQILLQSTQLSSLRPEVAAEKDLLARPTVDHGKQWPASQKQMFPDESYSRYYEGTYDQDLLTQVATPPIQEYSLKKFQSGRRKNTTADSDIAKDIERELDYVKGQYANFLQSMDDGSVSDSTTTSRSSDYFGENVEIDADKQPSRARRNRNEREELYGQVYISFVPINW